MEWKRFPIPLILAAVFIGAVLIIITINVVPPKVFYASSGNTTITVNPGAVYFYWDTWPGTVTVQLYSGTAAYATDIYYTPLLTPSYTIYSPLVAILTNAPKAFNTTQPIVIKGDNYYFSLEQDSAGNWWLFSIDTTTTLSPNCDVFAMNVTSVTINGVTYYLFYPKPTTATSTSAPVYSLCKYGRYELIQSWGGNSAGQFTAINIYGTNTWTATQVLTLAKSASSVSYTQTVVSNPAINRTDMKVYYMVFAGGFVLTNIQDPFTITVSHS